MAAKKADRKTCADCANGQRHDRDVYCPVIYTMGADSPWMCATCSACRFYKEKQGQE